MSDHNSVDLSEDEEDVELNAVQAERAGTPQEIDGILSKWTNYIHGWQDRYFVVKDGVMAYYKSRQDTSYGCRGSVSIQKAIIKAHDFDECRFDVSLNDSVWYLRAETSEEKQRWLTFLENYKIETDSGTGHLRRHGSSVSLTSNNFSMASTSSFRKGRRLREKVSEMETFRDILLRQIDTLQSYFDTCAESLHLAKTEVNSNGFYDDVDEDLNNILDSTSGLSLKPQKPDLSGISAEVRQQHGNCAVDFRGEALTFKATTAGILTSLQHCVDLMNQREDQWKRRLEREVDKRKKLDELYRRALEEAREQQHMQQQAHQRRVVVAGPDYVEGPHSTIGEDEFYDAVEAGLDKIEEEQEYYERLKSRQIVRFASKDTNHLLWPEIEKVTMEQLQYAKMGVADGVWTLFAEDGEMKMYKREEEIDGLAVDPLKAVHTVKGVTGREMCHYFFNPDVRLEWETTVEHMKVLESISEDTAVVLQMHKRVWPAAQRASLFWSHMRKVPNDADRDAQDIWIVCNNSTEHPDAPASDGKIVRVGLTVCLVCHTYLEPPQPGREFTRDNLTCRITYCSVVNPGGWVPTSALRAVYKREYPRFLKRFTHYVIERCQNQPIMF